MTNPVSSSGSLPEPIKLHDQLPDLDNQVSLAGVLPFIRHGRDPRGWEILVMIPNKVSATSQVSYTRFEMAKGKRQFKKDGEWQDISIGTDMGRFSPADLEKLTDTAFREGRQELGLKKENIASHLDLGTHDIEDITRRRPPVPMRLYAVEVKDNDLDNPAAFDPLPGITRKREWMSVQQFMETGLPSQRKTIENAVQNILQALHEGTLARASDGHWLKRGRAPDIGSSGTPGRRGF